MADPASGTPPSDNGAAIVSEQLTALLLEDEDTNDIASSRIPYTPPSSLETSYLYDNGENTAAPNRRPLFSSVREALESSGQLKEEPGGYVIKRHSGRQQQQQQHRSAERPKNRHGKRRSNSKSDTTMKTTPTPVKDEADAAGYTVILRRSSCDETHSSVSASATATATGRRGHRTSTPARGKKKTQQQSQRQRRGSMSALSQSSSLLACVKPPPSSSAPPGFQPCPTSRVLQPPPGLPPAASGWVVKAAAPAENVKKIEEPPVEALWPEMKATTKTESGWAAAMTTTSMGESSLQSQAWTATSSSSIADENDDDDLLTRLGVTL